MQLWFFIFLDTATRPTFECENYYELYARFDITNATRNFHHITKASALVCNPELENLFCYRTNESDWKEQKCNKTGNVLKCPLYKKFHDYSEFSAWKIGTYSVKIEIKNERDGMKYTTITIAATPIDRCQDIHLIESDDKMFEKPTIINCARTR